MKNLENFFNPQSIVLIGASANKEKVGYNIALNLIENYQGKIFFVNKKGGELFTKKLYKKITEIKEKIDLVVLAIPAEAVVEILDEIGGLGIKNVLVYAAGFKETGKEGEKLEQLLWEKTKKYQLNLLGPNCIGFINGDKKINLTFIKGVKEIFSGNIGFITQSGALGSVLIDVFNEHKNLNFSYFISLGNKLIINETDCLQFLKDDKNTDVILMYLESITNGKNFLDLLKKTTREKPVIILKSGRTNEGAKASLSHTGSLAGNYEIYKSALEQNGAMVVENLDEFFMITKILSYKRQPQTNNFLVITNGGGMGILAIDSLIEKNLNLILLNEKIRKDLFQTLGQRKKINLVNPLDILGDAITPDFKDTFESILKNINEKELGGIIVLVTPQFNTDFQAIAELINFYQKQTSIPFYPFFLGKKSIKEPFNYLESNKIGVFTTITDFACVLKKILRWIDYKNKKNNNFEEMSINKEKIKEILDLNIKKGIVNLNDSLKLLDVLNINQPRYFLYDSKTQKNEELFDKITYPVVVKVSSEKHTHKTDVGGVILDLKTKEETKQKILEIGEKLNEKKFIVQEMVKGVEIIIGGKKDDVFGEVVALGLGGIFTEILKEAIIFTYPFSESDFLTKLEETKINKIISGFRGFKPVDKKKIYEILIKINLLMSSFPQIKELDINPLIINKNGEMFAVDGRVILNE
ncbi:MAG: acetate--CoA ligase family protein [Patescibacteria group bacterium]|nr:acetate--CoA ligase family protein [Patescibacteria group bacterium]